MAASTGILLAVGGIGALNEFVHDQPAVAIRMGVATLGAAVVFAGIEQVPGGKPFAVGLALIALVGVVLGNITPGVPSPAVQLLDFMGYGSGGTTTTAGGTGHASGHEG